MSSKSTLLLLPCCHIYRDVEYTKEEETETLCIDVSYGSISYLVGDNDYIEVDGSSEFANLMRYLLKGKTKDELLKASKGG